MYIHKEYLYSAKEQKSHNAPRSQLQASPNKYVFSFCLKTGNVRFGRRRSGSSSFHSRGPAAVKLVTQSIVCSWRSQRRSQAYGKRQGVWAGLEKGALAPSPYGRVGALPWGKNV